MCDRFQCNVAFECLADFYDATAIGTHENSGDVLPRQLTSGLIASTDLRRELHPMQFAIAPPNFETPTHPTFSNHFAAIEEPTKWPWLTAIETSRCALPVSSFHVCCYWGDPEGTEAYFHRADLELLHVAGIYRLWQSLERKLYTMSFLTRPASDFVMDHGSHRQPIFLNPSGIDAWINPQSITACDAIEVLRQQSHDPQLTYQHVCDMPSGWTKRQKGFIRRRGQQLAAQDRCQHACGF